MDGGKLMNEWWKKDNERWKRDELVVEKG